MPRFGPVKALVKKSCRQAEASAASESKVHLGVKAAKKKVRDENVLSSMVKNQEARLELQKEKNSKEADFKTMRIAMSAFSLPTDALDKMGPVGKTFFENVMKCGSAAAERLRLASESDPSFSSPPYKKAKLADHQDKENKDQDEDEDAEETDYESLD
jgi:hypothetical protein